MDTAGAGIRDGVRDLQQRLRPAQGVLHRAVAPDRLSAAGPALRRPAGMLRRPEPGADFAPRPQQRRGAPWARCRRPTHHPQPALQTDGAAQPGLPRRAVPTSGLSSGWETLLAAGGPRAACKSMVALLSLAHERGCEAELAGCSPSRCSSIRRPTRQARSTFKVCGPGSRRRARHARGRGQSGSSRQLQHASPVHERSGMNDSTSDTIKVDTAQLPLLLNEPRLPTSAAMAAQARRCAVGCADPSATKDCGPVLRRRRATG